MAIDSSKAVERGEARKWEERRQSERQRKEGRKGRSKEGQRQKSGGEKVDGSAQERSQNALFVARGRKRDGERIPAIAIVGRPNVEHKAGVNPLPHMGHTMIWPSS